MSAVTRVNFSMLSNHVGKLVCVVGKVIEVNSTGNALKILTSDEKTVNVSLKDQYEETPGHCIQIIGTVEQNLNLIAEKFISFPTNDSEFDLTLYDKTIQLLPRYPDIFSTGGVN